MAKEFSLLLILSFSSIRGQKQLWKIATDSPASQKRKETLLLSRILLLLNEAHPVSRKLTVRGVAVYLYVFGFFSVQLTKTKLWYEMDGTSWPVLLSGYSVGPPTKGSQVLFPGQGHVPGLRFTPNSFFSKNFWAAKYPPFPPLMTLSYINAIKLNFMYIISMLLLFTLPSRIFCKICF